MRTIAVQIQDNYIQSFISYVSNHSENITIKKDKNLELDPYFYERQKELHQIRDDVNNGQIEMVSHKKVWGNIRNHLKIIKSK
jgi:hypothetical protein